MMAGRISKPFRVGLLCAVVLTLYACGSNQAGPISSTFTADAGGGQPDATTGADAPGDDSSPPIQFGDDAQEEPSQQEAAVDGGCGAASCADAQAGFCGDGIIEGSETCDDGNSVPGDGCSGVCQIEPGYTCPTPGLPCIYTVPLKCGDGIIEGNEACDDGNIVDGDGCSSTCQVEPGYSCTVPGTPCVMTPMPRCGDGAVNSGEQCDDGNNASGDGCSATCQLEPGFTCPTPGMPCKVLQYCGDGILQTAHGEQCDDGNAVPGDGCSGVCQIEPGYVCPTPGKPCVNTRVCGNGKVDPGEACDDGNTMSGDGCSSTCTVEAGYTCPNVNGSGGPCVKVAANTCGDGILGGTAACDDGHRILGAGDRRPRA